VLVNPSGDVVLNVFRNDLTTNPLTAPVWTPIAGMRDFPGGVPETAMIDDAAAVNTGSAPYTSGYAGFGFRVSDISRRCAIDGFTCARQL
jgi:hypothetical protein